MASRRDITRIVEAAYDLAGTDRTWLRQLAESAKPCLDTGFGIIVLLVNLSEGSRPKVGTEVSLGAPQRWVRTLARAHQEAPADLIRFVYRSIDGCATLSDVLPALDRHQELQDLRGQAAEQRIEDLLAIVALDRMGGCCALHLGLSRQTKLGPRFRRKWRDISKHIGIGLTLRKKLARLAYNGTDAIDAEAKAPHARVAVLREASRNVDAKRGRPRKTHAQEPMTLWRGLVAGRWSLVDSFASDGRRYLVARSNDRQMADPRRLTQRERQLVRFAARGYSLKRMGYELELAPSTVGTHLARAIHKLGLRSRMELLQLLAPAPNR
jgi:DNA-binding CsgD family transcriptional regulator